LRKFLSVAAACAVTVPTDATFDFPVGTEIVGVQATVGAVTFTPASGVTLNAKNNTLATSAQHQTFRIRKTGANVWLLVLA
jgi:hypothetical protein